uniref:Uncharacterized protein n=1 Tax=Aegilops tauschii subsp. strangulata TaxID=200361 RepID=A0A453Q4U6_AEGTS
MGIIFSSHQRIHPASLPKHRHKDFPLNTSIPSQIGQSYQQGMRSSQQQMHSQPFKPNGPQYMQQQHIPTSTSRSMSYVANSHQFQELGKSESAANATANTEVGGNTNGGGESSGIKPESLGDKNVNGEQNDFGNIRKI